MSDSGEYPQPPAPANATEAALRHARRLIIFVVGTTILLLGIAMLPLPGPGALVIFGGLGILAAEFVWARRLLKRAKQTARSTMQEVDKRGGRRFRRWIASRWAWLRGRGRKYGA